MSTIALPVLCTGELKILHLRKIIKFSMNASLPYGPLINKDIDYYQTFLCKSCDDSDAIFARKEKPVLAL